jgi:hypothetical protein
MNLLFTDLVTDETFSFIPIMIPPDDLELESSNIPISKHNRQSPYLSLLFGQKTPMDMTTIPLSSITSSPLTSLCSLQSLSIGMSSITDVTLYRIASFASLTELHLQWCSQLTDSGIQALVTNCQSIQILNLKSCSQLTDQSLHCIGRECNLLQHLDISWCSEFTDDGLLHLIPEYKGTCVQLKHLCLSWCPLITYIGSLFTLLHHLLHLRSMDLSGCVGITSECVNRIRKQRNELTINS